MADSGQGPEGNFATAATAPADAPLEEKRYPHRHADFPSAEDADTVAGADNSTLELCRLKNHVNIFSEDIANSDKIENSAMY
ncbi:hypothetical protein ElyMa_005398200 [Elysia marginata]|uniref:Uncharacterized protein n=1 Tax=Elysia marginata TaxID=1093978 RepID=A0AAV4EGT3_9GAST|nr:hypothetical protein ElyMa_005398200 [Elysia marginata]